MAVPDPTPAFIRFRASGDPEELAAVFDATAAELLRVASHLVSDPHAAEDVVQGTFLTAIESRDRFSSSQTVLPWLLGILTNHARRHRSHINRHPNPSRIARPVPPGPDAAAANIELTLAVTDAIQTLPEPYRPVLVLHLRHGFAPQDIALALGRPPGSVRSQLARGLDQLRRALPSGFAATMSCLIIPTQGLAAMRSAVLEAARVAAPAAATTIALVPVATGGVLLMKKSALILAAGLALVGFGVGYSLWFDAQLVYPGWGDKVTASGEGHATSPASVPNPIPAAGHKQVAEPTRERVATGNTRFRVVDEQGKALPGATVWLADSTSTSQTEADDVLLGTVARDGLEVATERFRADIRKGRSSLIAKHPGFLEYKRSLGSLGLTGDDPQEEVSIVLLRCSEQIFRFVDHQSRPLGGQTVVVSRYPIDASESPSSNPQPDRGNAFRASALSDSKGIARTQVPTGSFFIRVLAHVRYGVRRVSIKGLNKAVRLPREPIEFELGTLYAAGLIINGDVVVAGRCNFKGVSFRNARQGQLNTAARALARKWGMTGDGRMLAWTGFSTLSDSDPTARAVVLLKRAGWQEFKMSMKPAPEAAPLIVDATVLPKANNGILELKWSHGESLPMHELRTAAPKERAGEPIVQMLVTEEAYLPLPPGIYHIEGMLGNERYSPIRKVEVRPGKVTVVNLDPRGNVGILKLDLSVPAAAARQNLRFDLYQGNVVVDRRFLPRGKTHILLVESGRYRASLFTTGCDPVTKEIVVEGMGGKGASVAVWKAALKLAERAP